MILEAMKKILTLIAMVSTAVCAASGGEIYVAPSGCDKAAGTADAPLKSVGEALKRAREWRRLDDPAAKTDININLADGVYTLTKPLFIRPEDSGREESITCIKAAPGASPIISGGVEVTDWIRGTDDKRVPMALRDKIWVAPAPKVGNRIVETRQLYVGGHKARRAEQFYQDVMERMVDFNPERMSITVPAPDIDLSDAEGLEMYVHQRWAMAILRVKDISPVGDGLVEVTFLDPESQLEFAHPWPQPVIGGEKGNSSYFFANALQLLDQPGEWFQDYPSGSIYYYPREGEDMRSVNAVVPVLETLVNVDGSRERPVSDLHFEGLSFEYTSWLRPSLEGHVTLQGGFRLLDAYKLPIPGLPEKAELENQAWIARPEAAVTVSHASGINFNDCSFSHLGATGLDFMVGVSQSDITDCHFSDIGGTAIQIGIFPDGGFETHVPYKPAVDGDICSDITVRGNVITDATNEDWGCVGIGAGYVRDLTIADNEASYLNYSGICVGWGWTPLESGMRNNRIIGNYVHHFASKLYDAGGIYTLSNQPGSVIIGNRIEDRIDAPYATNDRGFYIYFDEATDGFTVDGNLCPDPEFGYNRPGPALIVKDNGPHIRLSGRFAPK